MYRIDTLEIYNLDFKFLYPNNWVFIYLAIILHEKESYNFSVTFGHSLGAQ